MALAAPRQGRVTPRGAQPTRVVVSPATSEAQVGSSALTHCVWACVAVHAAPHSTSHNSRVLEPSSVFGAPMVRARVHTTPSAEVCVCVCVCVCVWVCAPVRGWVCAPVRAAGARDVCMSRQLVDYMNLWVNSAARHRTNDLHRVQFWQARTCMPTGRRTYTRFSGATGAPRRACAHASARHVGDLWCATVRADRKGG
jgi:hypothetical protein